MYHPFFRGKQYELVMIRENAELLQRAGFTPIIEPVKEAVTGLARTLKEIDRVGGRAVVIVNPNLGDHSTDGSSIQSLLDESFDATESVVAGVLAAADGSIDRIEATCDENADRQLAIIHRGFADGKLLAASLVDRKNILCHVFLEEHCGKLYRKHFSSFQRVLVRDGFQRRANREHPAIEPFSDLHVTFREEQMNGFGDFLVVGDDYIEGGGPAYAVAIHITFIDSQKDDEMFIHHFVSDRTDTPTDPAGKFAEALRKLVAEVQRSGTGIAKTKAIQEFLDLDANKHFPGLGYVKKLSMQHHVETLDLYLNRSVPKT